MLSIPEIKPRRRCSRREIAARLYLLKEDVVVGVYDVAFGGDPVGHKVREGDERGLWITQRFN